MYEIPRHNQHGTPPEFLLPSSGISPPFGCFCEYRNNSSRFCRCWKFPAIRGYRFLCQKPPDKVFGLLPAHKDATSCRCSRRQSSSSSERSCSVTSFSAKFAAKLMLSRRNIQSWTGCRAGCRFFRTKRKSYPEGHQWQC